MSELKKYIHDEKNGLDYMPVGDYYIPMLAVPEEYRPIGCWDWLHMHYLEEAEPTLHQSMMLDGTLWTRLADLNE